MALSAPPLLLNAPPISTTCRSPLPGDLVDPVALLHDRGINDMNKLNLRALIDTLKSFNDIKKNGSYNIGLNYARQLIVVTKLLDEAMANLGPLGDACLATQEDLRHTADNIKASIGTQPYGHSAFPTYSAARGLTKPFHPLTMKPVASTEAQESDIFVSLKNTDKNSIFVTVSPTTLIDRLNQLLAEYFRNPSNGGLDFPALICSTSGKW